MGVRPEAVDALCKSAVHLWPDERSREANDAHCDIGFVGRARDLTGHRVHVEQPRKLSNRGSAGSGARLVTRTRGGVKRTTGRVEQIRVRTGHGMVQGKQRSANMVHGTGQAAVSECTRA
eukprot:scaffold91817_cov75-Phaeocystis_antarctica.AAC.4